MISNKKRTLMTILGIIVSVAMVTAVATGSTSFLSYLQRIQMEDSGKWHIQFNDVTVENLSDLEKDKSVENLFISQPLGYAKPQGFLIENESKPYLYIEQFNEASFEGMSLSLLKGSMPENENEIAVSQHLLNSLEEDLKVGDTITLELGSRKVVEAEEEYSLNQSNPFLEEEVFETTETKTYEIVGIVERPGFEGYSSPGYTAFTYLDEEKLNDSDLVLASVFLNKVTKNIYNQGYDMAKTIGVDEENVMFNDYVLRYYGVSRYDSFNTMVQGLVVILILIIVVGSVSLIYNSFAISLSERSKQFGMLSSVGATKKQKRNAVFYEGAIIGAIAIPIGIIAGIVGLYITFRIVSPMLSSSFEFNVPLQLAISYEAIIVAIVVSAITIFISAYIPARRASKISAMDAIRQSRDIKVSKKKVKSSKLTRVFLGLEGDLASKNMKRNKKRYRALIISLVVSIVLFISVGSYVFYLGNAARMYTEGLNYDLYVYFSDKSPTNILEDLKKVEGVESGTEVSDLSVGFLIDDKEFQSMVTKEYLEVMRDMYKDWGWSDEQIEEQMAQSGQYVTFYALDDASYEAYANEIGISQDKLPGNNQIAGIVINHHKSEYNYQIKEAQVVDTKVGDEWNINYPISFMEEEGSGEIVESTTISLTIQGITDKLPMGLMYSSINGSIKIVVTEETLDKILHMIPESDRYVNTSLFFDIDQPEGIEERITEILEENNTSSYHIFNAFEEASRTNQLILSVSIFAYGFITLISLICVTNLCNTIATSFALRRREFAMLKSVGMTPKGFHKMILLESLLYGIKALIYALPISIWITLSIYKTVDSNFTSSFVFPWGIYGIGILAVFMVVGIAMRYSIGKIKNDTIVEGLKTEIV